jgi:hypothetical protein
VTDSLLDRLPDIEVQDALKEIAKLDPYLWTATHRRLRGRPLVFDIRRELDTIGGENAPRKDLLRHRPFLIQPLCDQHPHKVYKKGRQIGVSELCLTEELCFLDTHPGTKAVHTFPRDTQLKDFSTTRINEALTETPAMQTLIGMPNQVYTKRIGDSYLILRSAWESNLGEGIDADMVSLDEKDRMKDGVDIAFRESLQSSRYGYLREISTPTLPGRGVDEPYMKSCQYRWYAKCLSCGMRQPVLYPENIIQMKDVAVGAKQLEPGTYEYRCKKEACRGLLDRLSGEWVAEYPSQNHIAGYHMPQTIAPWISATDLMQKKLDYRFYQLFSNYVLAECSSGDRILLSDEDFQRCVAGHAWLTHRTAEWSRVAVGIDWGHYNWVIVIGVNAFNNLPYIIGFFVVEDDDRDPLGSARAVDEFISHFDPDIILADAGYGKDRNAYLLKKYQSRFFAVYYNPSEKHSRSFKPQFIDQSSRVLADRTIALKTSCQYFRDKAIGLPRYDNNVALIAKHFKALAPMQILEDDGEMYEVIDHTGDDHLAHATSYAIMGFEKVTAGWGNFDCTW